jgi:predicted DNA binding CopG/RHH family protein
MDIIKDAETIAKILNEYSKEQKEINMIVSKSTLEVIKNFIKENTEEGCFITYKKVTENCSIKIFNIKFNFILNNN